MIVLSFEFQSFIKNINLGSTLLHTTSDAQSLFFLSCSHLVFNISLLFISLSNLILKAKILLKTLINILILYAHFIYFFPNLWNVT